MHIHSSYKIQLRIIFFKEKNLMLNLGSGSTAVSPYCLNNHCSIVAERPMTDWLKKLHWSYEVVHILVKVTLGDEVRSFHQSAFSWKGENYDDVKVLYCSSICVGFHYIMLVVYLNHFSPLKKRVSEIIWNISQIDCNTYCILQVRHIHLHHQADSRWCGGYRRSPSDNRCHSVGEWRECGQRASCDGSGRTQTGRQHCSLG